MPELYYAMCFDGNDEKQSNYYHCIALAENEEDFKASALKHRDVDFTRILTLTELLKETGLQKEILDLSGQVDDFNPVVFSKPIAFFNDQQLNERELIPIKQWIMVLSLSI